MKFKKESIPAPSKGLVITEPDQVVPDQSLSLHEILRRFTRNEALPVGHPVTWGGDDVEDDSGLDMDLEKLPYSDLTEKDEVRQRVAELRQKVEAEQREAEKKAKAAKEADEQKRFERKVRIAAKKLAQKPAG